VDGRSLIDIQSGAQPSYVHLDSSGPLSLKQGLMNLAAINRAPMADGAVLRTAGGV